MDTHRLTVATTTTVLHVVRRDDIMYQPRSLALVDWQVGLATRRSQSSPCNATIVPIFVEEEMLSNYPDSVT